MSTAVVLSLSLQPTKRIPTMMIVSETGHRIPSLFLGIAPRPEVAVLVNQSALRSQCGKKQSWIARLFTIGSVSAANCQAGECSGSYMFPENRECGGNCSASMNTWMISNPNMAGPCAGWQYTGDGGCAANDGSGYCNCLQAGCSTCL